MSDLLAALEADFVGHERLRRGFAMTPRYGNDDESTDAVMRSGVQRVLPGVDGR